MCGGKNSSAKVFEMRFKIKECFYFFVEFFSFVETVKERWFVVTFCLVTTRV
jgi:hypothetical protein